MALVNTLSKGIISCCFVCWFSPGFCGDIRRDLAREQATTERVNKLRDNLVDTARYFLFVREETGNNDGKYVERFLKEVNLKKGNPWCVAFVVSCHNYTGIPIPQSGYSPDMFRSNVVWDYTDWRNGYNTKPGQVFGIYFESKKRVAHVGIIESGNGKTVNTIEGNTDGSGSREGDGVYRKVRQMESIWVIADYAGTDEIRMEWRKKGVYSK